MESPNGRTRNVELRFADKEVQMHCAHARKQNAALNAFFKKDARRVEMKLDRIGNRHHYAR